MNKYIIFALLFVFVLNEDYKDYFYDGDDGVKCSMIREKDASVENCTSITIVNP